MTMKNDAKALYFLTKNVVSVLTDKINDATLDQEKDPDLNQVKDQINNKDSFRPLGVFPGVTEIQKPAPAFKKNPD